MRPSLFVVFLFLGALCGFPDVALVAQKVVDLAAIAGLMVTIILRIERKTTVVIPALLPEMFATDKSAHHTFISRSILSQVLPLRADL
ncbi:hypothetical protein Poly51_06640 [Rubripirellula tenax]|uniref:Uncharacterized protein n=1 Tax=Rubripirellula tenax TaxID=2528015 RepID=A0A5C6FK01_9BACT|nr:hypothetical protein [Rubripirellula tenax]TWU60389.1 hypothetical protein Poly51_06640 [Rubripirellula tenax]